MRKAISTKYVCPTNFRGSRVSASAEGGNRLIVEWDDALNLEENHVRAARMLAEKMKWRGNWVGGGTEKGYVFVNFDGDGFTIN